MEIQFDNQLLYITVPDCYVVQNIKKIIPSALSKFSSWFHFMLVMLYFDWIRNLIFFKDFLLLYFLFSNGLFVIRKLHVMRVFASIYLDRWEISCLKNNVTFENLLTFHRGG